MNNKAQKWKEKQKLIIVDKTMSPKIFISCPGPCRVV